MLATPSTRLLLGTIPIYSVLIVLGICAALLLASREEKRLALPQDTVVDLALWVIPFGVIGARLYYVAFAWDTFAPNPVSILYVWQGGLAIYGGIIGGLLGVYAFSRRKKIHPAKLTDIIVPGLALAQAIGRWGNYFNMEAYGLQITDPAWQFFPAAVLIPGHGGSTWHMATFFYESVWNLAIFLVLWTQRKRMHRTGDATLWYILLYGSGRLIIEGLRTDSLLAAAGTIRISQLLSVCMCLSTTTLFLARNKVLRKPAFMGRILAASIGTLLLVLLPRPAEAFAFYHLCWGVQTALVLLIIFAVPKACCMLPLLALIISIAVRLWLARAGLGGIEASTMLCTVFSLTAITSGIAAYSHRQS